MWAWARTTRCSPKSPVSLSSATAAGTANSSASVPRSKALESLFIDEVKIRVKAGDGGNGCLAFRREKFVPRGGPSGGDGGRGGDVVLVASQHYNTLLHFRFNPEPKAERGRHGEGSNRTGRDGKSIDLETPVGTVVYDAESGEKLHDFTIPSERFRIAKGGRGGRGNARFQPSTHQ